MIYFDPSQQPQVFFFIFHEYKLQFSQNNKYHSIIIAEVQ